jgi:hypothetical protein
MIDAIDGPLGRDDWAHIDWEKNEVWFEESDVRRPLSCSDIVFTRGKYAGSKLSEVSDSWYLTFIRDKNSNDYFIKTTFEKRLLELK